MKTEQYPAQLPRQLPDAARRLPASSSRPRTVLVFEMSHTGHHLRYVSLLTEAFKSAGLDVVLASTQAAFKSTEYSALMQKCDAHIQKLIIHQTFRSGRLRDLEHVYRLLSLMFRGKADLYFVPFLGTLYSKFGLLAMIMRWIGVRTAPVCGILLTWSFAYQDHGATKRRSWLEQLWQTILEHGPFERVFIVDEIAFDYIQAHYSSQRVIFSPEPIERSPSGDGNTCREALGIPRGAKVLGAFGCLDRSRGVQYLLEAFLRRGGRENEYLLIMGPQDGEVKQDFTQILGRYPKNRHLIMVDRFLSERELQEAFAATDVVAVTHLNFGATPTMLLRAAAAGKPVLGANDGWIGRIMSKYRLGIACDVLNPAELAAALEKALATPGINCPDAPTLADRYACERFRGAIIDFVCNRKAH